MKTSKFKMTELGPIPEDWEVKRLGEVGEPLMCKRILKSQTSDSGDIPFYKIGTFGKTADAFISRELFASFKRQYSYPHYGDVLISAAGTIGRTVVFDGHDAYFQDSNIVWIGHDEHVVLNKYLKWYLDIIKWQTENGGIVTRLYNDNLRNSLIVFPPLPEQEKIADALSDVDALLSAMSTLIEKKRNIKTGAMQELLGMRNSEFGMRNVPRRRLAGFSGEWVEKRLGDCGTAIRGVSYKPYQAFYESGAGRTMLLRSNNIQDNVLTFDDVVYVSEECIGDEQYMRCGDVLICAANGSRNLVGKSAVLKTMDQTVTFGAFMAIFRANSDIEAGFAGYLLQTESYRQQLDDILTGSAINNLNSKDILDLAFAVPPTLAEQKAIAAVLSDMDAEIAALEAKWAKYECIKQGMMQELLTGKTRLI